MESNYKHLLGFGVLVLVVAGSASALPRQMVEWTYYDSAAMTREVGSEIRPSCSGAPSPLHGRRTRFVARVAEQCQTGAIHSIACYLDGVLTSCPANLCESHLVECH